MIDDEGASPDTISMSRAASPDWGTVPAPPSTGTVDTGTLIP
jgi:hypothetical protein